MAGDEVTGTSIMGITEGLDSGPVYAHEQEPIGPEDTYGSLAPRLQVLGGELLVRVLDDGPDPVEQPETGVTYAEKITPQDRQLDPGRPADELERSVRALHPHIGAHLQLSDGSLLGVLEARVLPAVTGATGSLEVADRCPVLVCGPGGLALVTVKPPGRGAMSGEAWLRGHRL